MITISLFCCWEKVFLLMMNICAIGKNVTEHHYLKKNIFTVTEILEDATDADYLHAKRVCKSFEIKNLE